MSARLSLQPGDVLGKRYRLERHLAQGGMGAVYEARHLTTEMHVALKVLWPEVLEQAGARQRFELEARVAARVASPHIVKVLDAGFEEEGALPYLVMELLNGEDLNAVVTRRGPLEPRLVIELLRQVASGLDAAHGYVDANGRPQPIVHRDLKPANLFVSELESGRPFVRILDFGIAKVLGESSHVSTDLKGTPLYMAPEQVRGRRVSPQTDIWALGLIAYYLLTGKVYWRGAYGESPNVLAVLEEIGSLPRTAPSERLREQGIAGEVPTAFDAWLLRCLEAEPTRRFERAGQAVEALRDSLGESFRVSDELGSGTRPSGHSATDLASAWPSTIAEKSLTPVQSAARQPVKHARTLLYVGTAAAGLVGMAIALSSSRGSSEEGAPAASATAATDEAVPGAPAAAPPVVIPELEPTPLPATGSASAPSTSSVPASSSTQLRALPRSPKRAAPPATSHPRSAEDEPRAQVRTSAAPTPPPQPVPSARALDPFDLR